MRPAYVLVGAPPQFCCSARFHNGSERTHGRHVLRSAVANGFNDRLTAHRPDGQVHSEHGPPRHAVNGHSAAVRGHHGLHNGEAQTGRTTDPGTRGVTPREAFENVWQHIGRNQGHPSSEGCPWSFSGSDAKDAGRMTGHPPTAEEDG